MVNNMNRWSMPVLRACGCAVILTLAVQPAPGLHSEPNPSTTTATVRDDEEARRPLFVTIPGEVRDAIENASGEIVRTQWETVWRPMCGTTPGALSADDLLALAHAHRQAFAAGTPNGGIIIDSGGVAGGGINLVFTLDGSVPPAADPAFVAAEQYLESLFDDSITVTINVSFQSLPPGVLGGTNAEYTDVSWSSSRNNLQDDMDSNDNLQNYLPSGSKIPVRYNGGSYLITNETRVFWTLANYKAAIGSVSGDAGELVFNTDFGWDYNPANGISGYSFQDVLIHEVGHILGFSSGADYRFKDMDALDIYRFQRTNGNHDYNPDTTAEFKIRPRLVDFNKPNDDHNSDLITKEYRMADGDPYQCSHFREQSTNIGLMDPAIGAGQTFYPNFFSAADLKMFDAIGYDR